MTKKTITTLLNSVADLALTGPDGKTPLTLDDGTPVVIRVQSLNSQPVKQKSLEAMAIVKSAQKKADNTDDAAAWVTAISKVEQSARDIAITAVIGWDSKFDEFMGGPYSPEHVKELFNHPNTLFIVQQVTEFTQKADAFFA